MTAAACARRIMLAALCLLAAAAPAFAECAWVLWVAAVGGDGTRALPAMAFETRADCEKEGIDRDRRLRPEDRAKEGMRGYLICLPDTVDPRGPKGGTR